MVAKGAKECADAEALTEPGERGRQHHSWLLTKCHRVDRRLRQYDCEPSAAGPEYRAIGHVFQRDSRRIVLAYRLLKPRACLIALGFDSDSLGNVESRYSKPSSSPVPWLSRLQAPCLRMAEQRPMIEREYPRSLRLASFKQPSATSTSRTKGVLPSRRSGATNTSLTTCRPAMRGANGFAYRAAMMSHASTPPVKMASSTPMTM